VLVSRKKQEESEHMGRVEAKEGQLQQQQQQQQQLYIPVMLILKRHGLLVVMRHGVMQS
jgi:hypothetical protein